LSFTGLDVFDKTLQTTNIWLGELEKRLGADKRTSWHVLVAVLHALRDRLQLGLAVHLGAQLPILVRGIYYEQWRPAEQPKNWRSEEEFLEAVSEGLRDIRPVDAKKAATAVFEVLNHFVDPGQIAHVRQALPTETRTLWPESNPPLPRADHARLS